MTQTYEKGKLYDLPIGIFDDDLQTCDTETSIELNFPFAVLKFMTRP